MAADSAFADPADGSPADLGERDTPEARRRHARRAREGDGPSIPGRRGRIRRAVVIFERVLTGAWKDGFVHAGNLAYMTLISLFPFFIVLAAIFSLLGAQGKLDDSIAAFLAAVPPRVSDVIVPVARDVAGARHGHLLWIGGVFGLWSASSLIETLRDILRRAYGTRRTYGFWRERAMSSAVIFGSVLLLLVALSLQVTVSALEEIVLALFPRLGWVIDGIVLTRMIGAGVLFVSIYVVFLLLTPRAYRSRLYPKWPGAALVTGWWLLVANAMPRVLHTFFATDLTYGSLAGVMIALFFFWLVGLGMVVGAELNAALAETPEERDMHESAAPAAGPQAKTTRERQE
ncbi:YihY/virulence factor BrkB family protein [Novosphingobium colocasiae]|uniref:YihY/virulence factor BrkB family protein n=1 Tax=Novosphingobium colocasiae TaxID=1256513 RepID=UPI0035B4DB2B